MRCLCQQFISSFFDISWKTCCWDSYFCSVQMFLTKAVISLSYLLKSSNLVENSFWNYLMILGNLGLVKTLEWDPMVLKKIQSQINKTKNDKTFVDLNDCIIVLILIETIEHQYSYLTISFLYLVILCSIHSKMLLYLLKMASRKSGVIHLIVR